MPIILDGTTGIDNDATDLSYTGTLTGGTGVVNLGSGQVYKDASGNVGIGTGSPGTKLHVATAANTGLLVSSTDGTTFKGIAFNTSDNQFTVGTTTNHPLAFFTNNSERARIGASGGFTVSVGDMFASSATGLVGALGTYNTGTGSAANVHILSNGLMLRSTSSLKYKRDVQDATHGLAEVMALRSVTYKGKNPSDGEIVFGGLIAEEVHEAGLSEFVQYADDGTPDALAYGNMVSLCIKAIQELKAINDAQAQTIESLTARVVALEGQA